MKTDINTRVPFTSTRGVPVKIAFVGKGGNRIRRRDGQDHATRRGLPPAAGRRGQPGVRRVRARSGHPRNAVAWANERTGRDLAEQVDPDFVD
jgi:hypothetical protein